MPRYFPKRNWGHRDFFLKRKIDRNTVNLEKCKPSTPTVWLKCQFLLNNEKSKSRLCFFLSKTDLETRSVKSYLNWLSFIVQSPYFCIVSKPSATAAAKFARGYLHSGHRQRHGMDGLWRSHQCGGNATNLTTSMFHYKGNSIQDKGMGRSSSSVIVSWDTIKQAEQGQGHCRDQSEGQKPGQIHVRWSEWAGRPQWFLICGLLPGLFWALVRRLWNSSHRQESHLGQGIPSGRSASWTKSPPSSRVRPVDSIGGIIGVGEFGDLDQDIVEDCLHLTAGRTFQPRYTIFTSWQSPDRRADKSTVTKLTTAL